MHKYENMLGGSQTPSVLLHLLVDNNKWVHFFHSPHFRNKLEGSNLANPSHEITPTVF